MAEFVKQFNERTSAYKPGVVLPVKLAAFSDRTFTFEIKTPTTSQLIKMATGVKMGAHRPGSEVVGYICPEAVYEIAKVKQRDEEGELIDLECLAKSVVGTCNSMGIVVTDGALQEGEGDAVDEENVEE